MQTPHPARDFESVNGFPLTFIKREGKAPLLVEQKTGGPRSASEKVAGRSKVSTKGTKNKAAGERWVIHFVLLRAVTIPARKFLGWSTRLTETCASILGEAAARKTDPGRGGDRPL